MSTINYPLHPHFITNERGEKESVILSIKEYSRLLEDLKDLALIAERKSEPSISHNEFMKELQQDGLLQVDFTSTTGLTKKKVIACAIT